MSEEVLVYGIIIAASLMMNLFPIIGKKRNSIEISTFIMSTGYGGYTLSKNDEGVKNQITREEYLNKSLRLQIIFNTINIIYCLVCLLFKIDYIAIFLIIPIGFGELIAFWKNLKKYSVKI
ncbi:MAG: hypothetical protein ACRDDY_10480 [Clostridium sp.]|uniref:hypothetical protein n=1 Tax=Clostridium sp. TaxID=1506 RepID=UPI003EE7D5B1